MTIELYAAPTTPESETVDSPISNTTGELPDEEPALELGDLLGSFDSREEALTFIHEQASAKNQLVTNSAIRPFNDYTHVEWLNITLQNEQQATYHNHYYLVTDEGY